MRTKTLLIAAALGGASIASSMAQVYSANAVGYVNLSLGAGYTIIANPLNGTNNNLNTILPLPDSADGTTIYRFNPATQSYLISTFFGGEGGGWFSSDPANLILNPGEGAFIRPEGPTPLNVTFVGEVPQGNLSHVVSANYSIQASEVPQALPLGPSAFGEPVEPTLMFPAVEGDQVYVFDTPSQSYKIYSFFNEFGWSSSDGTGPDGPVIPVATGFFVLKSAAAPWTRQFSVN